MDTIYYDVFETAFGWVGVLASPKGLRGATPPHPTPDECLFELGGAALEARQAPERFEGLRDLLKGYFDGVAVTFDGVAIDVANASPYLRTAWSACRTIPYGETRSYGWLATQAGKPRAARAAGQSMARNRLAIIVPCHRVIAADGGLGGYGKGASGLKLKRRLLDLEANSTSD